MTDMLLYLLGILIVLIGIGLSIGLHELGHFTFAKLFGVKVTQFMIGFGKTLWGKKRGETEYGIKLLPLGGYVAMIGMYPPEHPGEKPRESTTGFFQSVVDEGAPRHQKRDVDVQNGADADANAAAELTQKRNAVDTLVRSAREASAETIGEGEEHRTFYRLPAWKKIVIMLAGPFVNLILAFVFYAVLVSGIGVATSTTTLSSVSECLVPADSAQTTCSETDPQAPAAAAGLRPGDTVTAIDGEQITSWELLRGIIGDHPNHRLTVDITRDGKPLTVTLTPAENPRVVTDEQGMPVTDSNGQPKIELAGMIGAVPTSELQRQSLGAVPGYVGQNIEAVGKIFLNLPQRMVDVWNAAFGAQERDPNGPVSVVGVGRMAGEVVSMEDTPVLAKAQTLVGMLAGLNVALFVFNLIPLMPLDGGHVLGAIYEKVKRSLFRLFGKADPGPIDTAKMVPVTFFVAILLGAMTLLLVYADLVKPVTLGGG